MEIKSIKIAKKRKKLASKLPKPLNHLAVLREITNIYGAVIRHGVIGLPLRLTKSLLRDSGLEPLWNEDHFLDLIGDVLLGLFDSLGPVYGKAGQVCLSHLSPALQPIADHMRLNRLYGDWPPIPFQEVEAILDEEIPQWHEKLRVTPYPLGVASMAQVHQAIDEDGREWVVKVIKPKARKRMLETLDAINQILRLTKPLAVTDTSERIVREVEELCRSLERELHLDNEKKNIDRMREKLAAKKQDLLRIPATYDELCTANVLTIEHFKGIPFSKLVSKHVELDADVKKKLAKKVLSELLVQVFELGLFHADPHAGNLILLEDGSVGLFDWGLQGELLETDRRHIAAILKAVISLDIEQLIDALVEMAREGGEDIEREDVTKELSKLSRIVKHHEEAGTRPTMHELMEASLKAADRLAIPVPNGLLLMAKSLLTIEGLARGIDPDVSFIRIATPVLFKAARPGLGDLLNIARSMPRLALKMFG